MKRIVVALAVIVAALGLVTAVAGAKTSNKAKAVAAVKEAVAEKWITFEVGPPSYLNVDGAHISVTCKRLSSSKYKCLWTAGNSLKQHASGGALVTVYGKGGVARLTNAKCEVKYGHC
jgi:hypothetical protein